MKEYQSSLHICGERYSYSKTDKDATFMHVKEDHMKNGQLKPCYNVNVATVSEYVIGSYLSADCTNANTLLPLTKQLPMNKIQRFVADAGYESEKNYPYFEGLEHTDTYIKSANHEQKKRKKYCTDPGRRENMAYDVEKDEYTCVQSKLWTVLVNTGKADIHLISIEREAERRMDTCRKWQGRPELPRD